MFFVEYLIREIRQRRYWKAYYRKQKELDKIRAETLKKQRDFIHDIDKLKKHLDSILNKNERIEIVQCLGRLKNLVAKAEY